MIWPAPLSTLMASLYPDLATPISSAISGAFMNIAATMSRSAGVRSLMLRICFLGTISTCTGAWGWMSLNARRVSSA